MVKKVKGFRPYRFVEFTYQGKQQFYLELFPGQLNHYSGTRQVVAYDNLNVLRQRYGDLPVVTVSHCRHGLAALRGWNDDGWHKEYACGELAKPYNQ